MGDGYTTAWDGVSIQRAFRIDDFVLVVAAIKLSITE
jgi:hypothetical protein